MNNSLKTLKLQYFAAHGQNVGVWEQSGDNVIYLGKLTSINFDNWKVVVNAREYDVENLILGLKNIADLTVEDANSILDAVGGVPQNFRSNVQVLQNTFQKTFISYGGMLWEKLLLEDTNLIGVENALRNHGYMTSFQGVSASELQLNKFYFILDLEKDLTEDDQVNQRISVIKLSASDGFEGFYINGSLVDVGNPLGGGNNETYLLEKSEQYNFDTIDYVSLDLEVNDEAAINESGVMFDNIIEYMDDYLTQAKTIVDERYANL